MAERVVATEPAAQIIRTITERLLRHAGIEVASGITHYLDPEVALLFTRLGLDVLGDGFEEFPAALREQIVAAYPRQEFNEAILQAFFGGFAHKHGSTWGTVKAGVCERYFRVRETLTSAI